MHQFSLQVKNPYYPKKKFSIALLHFTAGFLLLDAWYETAALKSFSGVAIAFLILACIEVAYAFFAFRFMHRFPVLNGMVRLVSACAFLLYSFLLFFMQDYLFGAFMAFIALAFVAIFFMERKWVKPFIVTVNEKGILLPGMMKATLLRWQNFNHIILRDNVLTLDMASNKVIQLDVYNKTGEQQVQVFNTFCSSRIKESR